MNSVIKYCFILFGCCLLNSCIISQITQSHGFYSGFENLSDDEIKNIVVVKNKDTLPTLKDKNTYAITATHLKHLIIKNSPCVVYLWDANCSGSSCISLNSFNKFCKENNYHPIIVSEYFDVEQIDIQGVTPSSVFAINHWFYGTDYCNSYVRRFQKELFSLFNSTYNPKYPYKFIYYDNKTLSNKKPANFGKYPWEK